MGDYHLQAGSPVIDLGPAASVTCSEDIDGELRMGFIDIGADEWIAPTTPFVRGDADGNGEVVPIVDAITILNFQFVLGAPEPPCLDAADADGDGAFNGLLDGLYALSFGFVDGPAPPPPFPLCGSVRLLLGCDEGGCP